MHFQRPAPDAADTHSVHDLAAFIPTRATSRYDLINAFCEQLAQGMTSRGVPVNPDAGALTTDARSLFVFFNFFENLPALARWISRALGPANAHAQDRAAIAQWIIDHPFHMDPAFLDDATRLPAFRLITVSDDDTHLLRLRWPSLRHTTIAHGVPASALRDPDAHPQQGDARDVDVLVCGSIHTHDEARALGAGIPDAVLRACDELVALRLAHPWLSFGQAFEITMPRGVVASPHWNLLAMVFRLTTALLNRARRTTLLAALQGFRVTLIGTPAWQEFATGSVRYAGQVPYAQTSDWMARSKVVLALNPTQFTHAWSERLLLGLAAGAACVTDDRPTLSRDFPKGVFRTFPASDPGALRAAVGELLSDADARDHLARAGHAQVRERHLWLHRVPDLFAAAGIALPEAAPAPPPAKLNVETKTAPVNV